MIEATSRRIHLVWRQVRQPATAWTVTPPSLHSRPRAKKRDDGTNTSTPYYTMFPGSYSAAMGCNGLQCAFSARASTCLMLSCRLRELPCSSVTSPHVTNLATSSMPTYYWHTISTMYKISHHIRFCSYSTVRTRLMLALALEMLLPPASP